MKVTSLYLIGICLIAQVGILTAADGKKEISTRNDREWQFFLQALTALEHKRLSVHDINKKNEQGRTLLHSACKYCCNRSPDNPAAGLVVQAILEAKADVNAGDNKGYTPLQVYGMSHFNCCRSIDVVLLYYGASKDDRGTCVVRMALAI